MRSIEYVLVHVVMHVCVDACMVLVSVDAYVRVDMCMCMLMHGRTC